MLTISMFWMLCQLFFSLISMQFLVNDGHITYKWNQQCKTLTLFTSVFITFAVLDAMYMSYLA